MRLQDWLKANGKTASGFSREIGLAGSTLVRVIDDGRSPTDDVMRRIIIGTRGEVQPNDFFPISELLGVHEEGSEEGAA